MLWQKSWWETRLSLFLLIGVVLFFAVWRHPWEQADLNKWASSLQRWETGLNEDASFMHMLKSYHGYVWTYWFKLVLLIMWPIYAVTIGSTLVATSCPWMMGGAGAAGLFTFSLPVTRRKV